MALHKLRSIVAPPLEPREVGDLDGWKEIEKQLGTALPDEYRDFIFTYGTGQFAHFYGIFNPFAANEYAAFLPSVKRICDAERETKRNWPEVVPYPIYPEPGGLLPWGCDDNGNYYFWVTSADANTWQVVSDEVRGEGFREYGRNMTEFLTDVLLGKIEPLAGGYPCKDDFVFEQWPK
jgi:hypothetical protein